MRAEKKEIFDTAPSKLMLHLKRFRYDPFSRRRSKLTSSVYFPEFLDAACLGSGDRVECKERFRLSSILIHTGTASKIFTLTFC